MINHDLVIIGAGPAGLAAALAAEKNGVKRILLLERDKYLGGILQQCIHNGFGLEYFREELTGPEYAHRFIEKIKKSQVKIKSETMVVNISQDKLVTAMNRSDGILQIQAKAIVLAMGCRERTREAILIPGTRPAGIFTAGSAQRYVNLEGFLPGKKVIILGSGDIGLIMARRMMLEGAEVKAVLEIMPYSSGLLRNQVQCLDDFGIPLRLQHTITRINGLKRVDSVVISRVDQSLQPIPGTEELIDCDTILFSVGLIPENELSTGMGIELDRITGGPIVNELRETVLKGVFACGNVLQVHDLVDYVTEEAEIAGKAVADYLKGMRVKREQVLNLLPGTNVAYIVPQQIAYEQVDRKRVKLFLRVRRPAEDVRIDLIAEGEKTILSYRRSIVTPGEMVTFFLPEAIIGEKTAYIKVSVEKNSREKEG
ncbi:MAG: NAD(P)/FAD-dependent oxidoreductase [Halanaerobiales bacterium]|nr:NAD(P)/FAD-dependent oxidoreductase [Halanaerobiales bacterium]